MPICHQQFGVMWILLLATQLVGPSVLNEQVPHYLIFLDEWIPLYGSTWFQRLELSC